MRNTGTYLGNSIATALEDERESHSSTAFDGVLRVGVVSASALGLCSCSCGSRESRERKSSRSATGTLARQHAQTPSGSVARLGVRVRQAAHEDRHEERSLRPRVLLAQRHHQLLCYRDCRLPQDLVRVLYAWLQQLWQVP